MRELVAGPSTVTVVIVDYSSAEHTVKCLESLRGESVDRIVVVDNGGSDENFLTLQRAVSRREAGVELLRTGTNLGFAGGVNFGVNAVDWDDDDILWLLNPDCLVAEGAVDKLVRGMLACGASIASPIIVTGPVPSARGWDGTGAPVWYAGGRLDLSRGLVEHEHYGDPWMPGLLQTEVPNFITGAALLTTKRVWDEIGGLDERYFLYWEDVDFSVRAMRLGHTMTVVEDSVVWHREGGAATDAGRSYLYYTQRNRILVMRRLGQTVRVWDGLGAFLETFKLLARALRTNRPSDLVLGGVAGLFHGLMGKTGRMA